MGFDGFGRRDFLRGVGATGLMAGVPAFGSVDPARVVHEVAAPGAYGGQAAPKYSVKFAVCGMSHDHIYGMVEAVKRGGDRKSVV